MVPSLLGHPTHMVYLDRSVSGGTSKQRAVMNPSGCILTHESELEQEVCPGERLSIKCM